MSAGHSLLMACSGLPADVLRKQTSDMKDPTINGAGFSLAELRTLICGEQRIEWSMDDLRQFVVPGFQYTPDNVTYQLLLASQLLFLEYFFFYLKLNNLPLG